jgi:hypothetical protein
MYRAEFLDVPSNLNEFWKKNEESFPKLAKFARRLLSIPASTAFNERMFSRLHYQLSDYRNPLSGQSIESLFIYSSFQTYGRDIDFGF